MRQGLFFSIACLLAGSALAQDTGLQDLLELKSGAERFVSDFVNKNRNIRSQIETGNLDSRLRLTSCESPVEYFTHDRDPGTAARVNVAAKCAGPKPWQVFIPVEVFRFGKVAVATQPLRRNQEVGPAQVKWVEKRLEDLPRGYILANEQVMGMRVVRNVRLGSVISPTALRPPHLVKKGEKVTILARAGGITIRMVGEAVSNGAKGELVRVKNLSSERIVQAIVQDAGVVQVRL